MRKEKGWGFQMVSIVIPACTLNEELEEMAIICALSYREQVDQLIICEDGGKYSKELQEIADTYIYNKKTLGFTRNVNQGWKISEGDFTMIVNSDTQLLKGDLIDLCVPGKVVCPQVSGYEVEKLCGAFFVVPQSVKERYGLLDETYHTYGSDSEYEKRIGDIFEYVPSVDIYHIGDATNSVAGIKHP